MPRSWFLVVVLGSIASFLPFASTAAQSETRLATLRVRLWPEYDQPSMLVLYDFTVATDTALPANVTIHLPRNANLIAVASEQASGLVNTPYEGPVSEDGGQSVTIPITIQTTYHLEYYQPLEIADQTRRFSYRWDGAYAVGEFSVALLEPPDTLAMTTNPELKSDGGTPGLTEYRNEPVSLGAGEEFVLSIEYERTSQALAVPPSTVQPSAPIDESTAGRVSFSQFLPWVLGGVGFAVVVGGVSYYLLARRPRGSGRRRRRSGAAAEGGSASIYCPQCGARAKAGDQFCRVCDTRLTKKE